MKVPSRGRGRGPRDLRRSTQFFLHLLGTAALGAVLVAMPLGCTMSVPPEPDSGTGEDASAGDAHADGHADAGDAALDHAAQDGADAAVGTDAANEDVAAEDATAEDATAQDAVAEDADAGKDATVPEDADAAEDVSIQDVAAQDAPPTDAAEDAMVDASADGTTDAGAGDGAVADADLDSSATTGDASVVITGGGDAVLATPCGVAPDTQILTFSNPSTSPATWTSTVSGADPAFLLPTVVPSGSTVAPGGSVDVSIVFPAQQLFSTQPIHIDIASGGSVQMLSFLETVYGYSVTAAPTSVDFGTIGPPGTFQTVNIAAQAVSSTGSTSAPSPCSQFALMMTGSPDFGILSCGASASGGANVTFQFAPPPDATPGPYQATYTFVPGSFGPPCGPPLSFNATATVPAPAASDP